MGYRRIHGEPAALGVKVAASTVWQILKDEGIDPAPEHSTTSWADFLRSRADALLACDFIETVTLTGRRQYILAAIEHARRRIRIPGTTAHLTADWVTQTERNLVMDLEDAGEKVNCLIRDRDTKFPALFDAVLADAGIEVVLSGVQTENELNHGALGADLPPRTSTAPCSGTSATCSTPSASSNNTTTRTGPTRPYSRTPRYTQPPEPITDPDQIAHLDIRRHDRLGGVIHEYRHTA
ncbi:MULTISPECIES: IS481 family transposase [unclassified Streptomyces]|uniref:IS481 family transposase n=1 Tax=unclassified Streptomyces TaxID=2593676 RepID=UPI003820786A